MLEWLEVIGKILFVVFFFGFCIFIHEFGHLIVAYWRGLHIERFSVGFGPPIVRKRWRGIDYQISWLPFGGFVSLPQLEPSDTPQSSDGKRLPGVKPVDRILTALAGPVFNILFGFFLAIIIWQFGVEEPAPSTSFKVGYLPESYVDEKGVNRRNPEYDAGLRVEDEILAINGSGFTKGWSEARERIIYSPDGAVSLAIKRAGEDKTIDYELVGNPSYEGIGHPFFEPLLPTRVGSVSKGSPAEAAGLQPGDILLEINGERVVNSGLLIDRIQMAGGAPITLKVERDGKEVEVPGIEARKEAERYLIGIGLQTVLPPGVIGYPSPWLQFTDVLERTYKTLRRLFDKRNPIKARHMSGPVGIFQMLWLVVSNKGFMAALQMVLLVSFSLAIINLLPLPILDGGHITFALAEIVSRRKVPTQVVQSLSYVFAVFLISFMLYVTYYDSKRLVGPIRPTKSGAPSAAPATPPPAPPSEAPAK